MACEAFLKDEESYRAVADRLVKICYSYGFDGWLINIENTLSVSHVSPAFRLGNSETKTIHFSPASVSLNVLDNPWASHLRVLLQVVAVRNTPLFLRYLTDQMHERVPDSLVLWYDSVTENGQLQWQNELNASNR